MKDKKKNTKNKHFIGTVSQKVIIIWNNKILVEQHKGTWNLPGGRLHFGENLLDGVKREIEEEVGLSVEPKFLTPLTFVNRYKEQKFALVYSYELNADQEPTLTLQIEEIDEAKWITKEELPEINMYPEFKKVITSFLRTQESSILVSN